MKQKKRKQEKKNPSKNFFRHFKIKKKNRKFIIRARMLNWNLQCNKNKLFVNFTIYIYSCNNHKNA